MNLRHFSLLFTALSLILAACTAADNKVIEPTRVLTTPHAAAVASQPPVPPSPAFAVAPMVSAPRPATSPTPIQYTVQSGDTLFDIALKFGVTIESIAATNQIANLELIHPGQILVIPTPPAQPVSVATRTLVRASTLSRTTAVTHTVQMGDTLFDLALGYGVTIQSIVAANQIDNPEFIRPGQTLIIPAESAVQSVPAATRAPKSAVAGTPSPLPGQVAVNGVPLSGFVVMSTEVKQHIREIYRQGQVLGRNPRAFAKVGDSTIANGFFMPWFDQGSYNLGNYAYLQGTAEFYSGSFGRNSVAVGVGYHTTTVLDPLQTNPVCQSGETLVECEFRLTNPSVVVIRLGANDVGMPDIFERKIRQIVEFALSKGVIPVLGTKADRQEGPANTINDIIRQVAVEYKIPLWDFDVVAQRMPNRGLASDNIHPTTGFSRDYTRPETFQLGHEMQDLTALMMLDAIWREVAPGAKR